MIKKIKNILLSLGLLGFLISPALVTSSVSAADADINKNLCAGSNLSLTDTNCKTDGTDTKVNDLVNQVVTIFSWVVGVVSVIMIIYGGFRYITSGGDSNGVTAAKNTILYAIIGLVVVALAQVIVKFVINKAGSASS